MFTINYGGQNLSILFKNDPNVLRVGKRGFENVEQISCAIVGDDNVPKAVGSAVRSEQDGPNDALGMEIALGRALKRLTNNKAVRADFWQAFHRAANLQDIANFEESLEDFLRTVPVAYAGETDVKDNVIPFVPATTTAEQADYNYNKARIEQINTVLAKHGVPNCNVCNKLREELEGLVA